MGSVARRKRERQARPPDASAIIARLAMHEQAVEQAFPCCWAALADFRRRRNQLPHWPQWCWLPLAGAADVVSAAPPPVEAMIIPPSRSCGAM